MNQYFTDLEMTTEAKVGDRVAVMISGDQKLLQPQLANRPVLDQAGLNFTHSEELPGDSRVLGGASSGIRDLLRKHFPQKELPPKPELPRPLWTGVVDFSTY